MPETNGRDIRMEDKENGVLLYDKINPEAWVHVAHEDALEVDG